MSTIIRGSGDTTFGGTIQSTGIDDNATSTAITIDASENVGIGTASPGTKLHLTGSSANVSSDTSNGSLLNIDGGSITATNYGVGINFLRTGSQLGFIKAARENTSNEAAFLSFATQNSTGSHPEALRITSDGRGLSQFTAKAWANCKQTGTQSIRDSHNCSSITDMEVGGSKLNFTNNMASATFVTLVSNQWGDVRAGVYNDYRGVNHTRWYCVTAGGQTQVDADTTDVMVFGD
jgi:hypothetical protein